MIQLAWRFLMFQSESALAQWFRSRTAQAPKTRKTLIVALARKLLITWWTMLQEAAWTSAVARSRVNSKDNPHVVIIDLDPLHEGANEITLGRPIRRFQPIGDDRSKSFEFADDQLEATGLLGGRFERRCVRLKLRHAPAKLRKPRLELCFVDEPLSIAVNEPADAAADLGQLAINRLKLDPARASSRRMQPLLVFVENAGGVLEQATDLLPHRRVHRRDGHDPSIAPALTMEPMALGPRAAIVVIPAARFARIARLPAATEGVAALAADQQSLQQVAHAGAALPMAAPVLGQLLLGALKQLSFDNGWYGNPDPVLARRRDLAKRAFGHPGPTARRAQRWAPRNRGVFPKDGLPGISGVRQQRPEHAAAPVGVPGRARHAGLEQPPGDR